MLTTLKQGFEVVHFLMKNGGTRVSEIAEQLDVAPSAAHNYLTTLYVEDYVMKEGDEYHGGMRFLTIGGCAKYRKKAYRVAAHRAETLIEEISQRAQFMLRNTVAEFIPHRGSGLDRDDD